MRQKNIPDQVRDDLGRRYAEFVSYPELVLAKPCLGLAPHEIEEDI